MTELADVVTAAEAARILGRSQKTVNRLARDGQLPVAKQLPGERGARLFVRADVEALRDAEIRSRWGGEAVSA